MPDHSTRHADRLPAGFATMLAVFASLTLVAAGEIAAAEAKQRIEFNRDVRPILSDKCFTCHGPDPKTRKADLRLDTEEGALADLGGYHAIVKGKPDKSEVYLRLITEIEDDRMPPAKHEKQLTKQEIATIKAWIEQGAGWQKHWSLIPPSKPALPDVKPVNGKPWANNMVDRFVLAKLQSSGLTPSSEADRRTLIRRLSFDLVGLPPTSQEVDAFINDKSPDAYEKLVDRLLASKHYGERMAIHWLDLVRYADSIGYHSDNPVEVWLYRDYVIKAFNENYRFDRFTREQLAGDLLKDPTWEQRIATGYNRLLQTTQEGGAQAKEYLAKYSADRVRSFGSVWLGATLGCAECHDHKYDPYSMHDFYSLAAFFADIKEKPLGARTHTPVPTESHLQRQEAIAKQIKELQQTLNSPSPELAATLAKEQQQWEAMVRTRLRDGASHDVYFIDDKKLPKGVKQSGAFNYVDRNHAPVHSGSFSRKQSAGGLVQHYIDDAKTPVHIKGEEVFFAYVYLDPKNPPKQVMIQFNNGSWNGRAWWGGNHIPYGKTGKDTPAHRYMGKLPATGQWVRLEVPAAKVGLKKGQKLKGMAFTQWGGTVYWDAAGHSADGVGLPADLTEVVKLPAEKRTKQQAAKLAKHFAGIAPSRKPLRDQLVRLTGELDGLKKGMPKTLLTMSTNPRMIRVLPRGNWLDDSGEAVQPSTPKALPPLGVEGRRATRLDLANWLLRDDNPMTARNYVNHLWKLFFGYGLARTMEDMGSQGEWPTHPRLLDALAVDFRQSGWDIKRMVKQLVMSNAYRQNSVGNRDLRAKDPYNKLFARQSRWHLDAEMVRDNALAISGLLVTKVGGASVKPYQPDGYWQHLNFPRRRWQQSSGDDLWRRGLYTHWQRSFLHPSLLAFDAQSREEAVANRPRSNTPLQALVLLNDPTYVEASRVFAERLLAIPQTKPLTDAGRIRHAFRLALQREASTAEVGLLEALLNKHRAEYKAEPQAAKDLLTIGAKPSADGLGPAEVAAWASVTRVLLNLHETITRD